MQVPVARAKINLRTILSAVVIALVVAVAVFAFVEIALPVIQLHLLPPSGHINHNLIPSGR
jgi:hypothetical protein